ncbi:MAG TPA: hypothetical protein VNL35_05525, partial [Chloroflexota bacterium]|nr:hypothetical protein [Chloroflexota bacterium]
MKINRPGHQRLPEDDPLFAGLVADLKLLHRVSPPDELQWRADPTRKRIFPRQETKVIHTSRAPSAPTDAGRGRKFWLPLSAATIILALGGLVSGLGTLAGHQVHPLRPAIGVRDLGLAGVRGAPNAAGPVWEAGWPMVGHDPQQTSRSPGLGPLSPHLLWTYRGMVSPVIVGPDGTVYGWTAHSLTALAAGGKQRWSVPAREDFGGPPALGSDGLLCGSGDLTGTSGTRSVFRPIVALFAVSPQGKQVWAIRSLPWATVPESVPFSKGVSPIVTAANLLYVPFVGPSYT